MVCKPALGRALPILGLFLLSVHPLIAVAQPTVMTIQADAVGLDLSQQTTEANGHARLSYGDLELEADRVKADRGAADVEASGHLAMRHKEHRLEGDHLRYNSRREEGVLENATAHEQGVIIRGEKIEFSPRSLVAHRAYLTTCDKADPDYSLSAERISLTAPEARPGRRPESGRLTLDRARVTYHGRRLFTLPRYSVSVGQLGQPGASPFPASGFDREDGPYAQLSYSLGRPGDQTAADFSYRYTSFRGIRGYLKLRRGLGPLELGAGYVRREASTDRELRRDQFSTGLANVMVSRTPEFRASLLDLSLGRTLHLGAEVLQGTYSESEQFKSQTRARADRTAVSSLLWLTPYRVSRGLALSHAIGWRQSNYSSGERLSIRLVGHSLELAPSGRLRLSLSYVTRHSVGKTPFLFDGIEVGRELLAEARVRVNPRWRLRVVDLYDLKRRDSRDFVVSVTRTIHCLDYTLGWRKSRGTLFLGINLTPPAGEEGEPAFAGLLPYPAVGEAEEPPLIR